MRCDIWSVYFKCRQCSNWNDVRDSMISAFVLVALVLCLWSFWHSQWNFRTLHILCCACRCFAIRQVAFATPAQLGLGLVTWQQWRLRSKQLTTESWSHTESPEGTRARLTVFRLNSVWTKDQSWLERDPAAVVCLVVPVTSLTFLAKRKPHVLQLPASASQCQPVPASAWNVRRVVFSFNIGPVQGPMPCQPQLMIDIDRCTDRCW